MNVGREGILWLVPLLTGAMMGGVWVRSRSFRRLDEYLSGHPGPEFWPSRSRKGRQPGGWWLRGMILFASGASLVLALAEPRLGTRKVPVSSPAAPLFLLLDVSPSMLVQDAPGNRLAGARMVARRVLGEIPEIPIGLGVFAGSAHLLLPPTADRALLLSTLDAADPSILSERGTRLASALEAVRAKQEEALGQGGFGVLILSDGEDHGGRDEALSLAREIQALGGWVAAVSLGSRSGGPVPSLPASPGMLMSGLDPAEAGGDRPQSRADPEFLAEVARSGGGVFASGDSPEEVKALLAYLGEWGAVEATGVKMEEVPLEAWPLFLALALAGLFLEGALDHWSLRRYASSWR